MCSCYECRVHGRDGATLYTVGRMDRRGNILDALRVRAESPEEACAAVRRVWLGATLVVLRAGA